MLHLQARDVARPSTVHTEHMTEYFYFEAYITAESYIPQEIHRPTYARLLNEEWGGEEWNVVGWLDSRPSLLSHPSGGLPAGVQM